MAIMGCNTVSSLQSGIYIYIFTNIYIIMLKMATMTVYVPQRLKDTMDAHPEIKWTEIMRRGVLRKLEQVKKFEQLVKEGKI